MSKTTKNNIKNRHNDVQKDLNKTFYSCFLKETRLSIHCKNKEGTVHVKQSVTKDLVLCLLGITIRLFELYKF